MKAVNVMSRKASGAVGERGKSRRSGGKDQQAAAKAQRKSDNRKKTVRKASGSQVSAGAGLAKARQYVREVAYELRKVVWPSRKETVASTAVVLVIVILCGIYLGVVDFILNRFVRLLIG